MQFHDLVFVDEFASEACSEKGQRRECWDFDVLYCQTVIYRWISSII